MALRATIQTLLHANLQSVQCLRWIGVKQGGVGSVKRQKKKNFLSREKRHTKGEKDNQFAKLSHRYSMMIGMAIKEHGMETNPEKNKTLKR